VQNFGRIAPRECEGASEIRRIWNSSHLKFNVVPANAGTTIIS
jgi:hypothetical protein